MKNSIPILLITVILTSCAAKLSAEKKYQLDKQLKDMVEVDQIAANIPKGKYKEYSKQQVIALSSKPLKDISSDILKADIRDGFTKNNH